ncbi:cbb3-type cytochrome c oxidase subunit I [Aquincola sp. S2]|uniref:Cbb3-type cytochrome c oxidase subunit I n=1 Tax=Pseudaquabacterium terrae TaxID=2732868 RepID=A0ABX2EI22_9BURK|nr:cbb3-type cytochrome c oxidase subunit I [Aquabacterium terrae]NRF68231.1 cbb3-type cytochrome c oxidase subunit I [Aquabacterium terrae]
MPIDDPTLPNALPRPPDELPALERAWQRPRGWRRLTAVNNTQVGLYYIATALLFFVLAGVLALVMRAQLAWPGQALVSPALYNQLFTMHGTVMMFLFAVPVVEAIAVYLLPGMLGARDLPFPRLSAYAYWAYAVGGLAFFCTLFFGVAPDGGWFMNPPLTSGEHSPGLGADFWLLGIGFIEISAIAGAIELLIGILMTRAPGMTLGRMPVFGWAMLVVGAMILFAFPAVIAGTLLLELERAFDWPIFTAARGGDPLLWQHLFWFFGHPEVYIIFLPAAGLVSMMIPALSRTPLVAYRAVVWALVAVGVLSFALWAHHMFTAGLSGAALLWVSAASLAIAVPTGVQVFAWLATLWRGRPRLNGAMPYLIAFLLTFVAGGLTGVMLAVLPFDRQAHDTHFVVAHLHYVLIGGMVFPVFAALVHWGPLINGHALNERMLRWSCALMFFGFHAAFFPLHVVGLLGMPRRIATYDAGFGWAGWNLASTIGAFVFAAGVLLFFIEAAHTWRKPEQPHGDPWQGGTLEWLPSEDYGMRSIPQVSAREPLWQRPALKSEVEAGRHWLPGTATGGREALVTHWRRALPQHLLVLTGDSWWPFIAAVGTAGFFLLLTVQWVITASLCGVVAVAATLRWLWDTDRAPAGAQVRVARDVMLPVGARGAASHSWWATWLVLLVDATIFASLAFAHLHVAMRAEVCPPPGARLPGSGWAWAAAALWGVSAAAIVLGWRRPVDMLRRRSLVWPSLSIVIGCLAALAAFALDLLGHQAAGLEPRSNAWSATVAALLGWQGFHAALLLVMAGYLLARWWRGQGAPGPVATRDNVALFWLYVAAQGALTGALVQLLPRVLG